ncbi:MAG: ROK family protein [Tidjanibacter sp.]|nr:ROK family protein [Tidjanibacter sp.]
MLTASLSTSSTLLPNFGQERRNSCISSYPLKLFFNAAMSFSLPSGYFSIYLSIAIKESASTVTNRPSELSNFTIESLESKDIYEAATRGDEVALEAFERTGEVLGMGIAAAVAVTSPEAVFLFGGLAKSGKYILEPTKKYMEQYMLKNFRNKIKLLPSGIDSANAAILGASALAWQKYNQLHVDEK